MKKGSISVYLCLAMCVIVTLLFACMESARTACGRTALSCSLEESLFSVLSNYDRTMYEKFGLLLLDGGYGTDTLQAGALARETDKYVNAILNPAVFGGTTPKELYRISLEEPEISGYVLASDNNYAALRTQICELMTQKLGVDALGKLTESLSASLQTAQTYSVDAKQDAAALFEEYEAKKEQAAELQKAYEETQTEDAETGTAGGQASVEVEIPENFVNPLDNAKDLMELGIYAFSVPDPTAVSKAKLDTDTLISHRSLEQGFGMSADTGSNAAQKVLLTEYCMDFLSNFLTADGDEGLQYKAEYVIAGKESDMRNLHSVLDKLMLLREGLNYLYLYMDAEKNLQIHETAAIISAVLVSPEAEESVAQLLMFFWAYAESAMDIRALLAGSRIPLFKDADSWQVSLNLLSYLTQGTQARGCDKGLTYSDYLRLLLYMQPEQTVLERTMDMLEYSRCMEDGTNDFCLDHCLTAFQIGYTGGIGKQEITISRSCGYDM